MSWASPSTMAVLPTPASPSNTGLFFWRRERIWTTRSISLARPMTGSSLPCLASSVRSRPKLSSAGIEAPKLHGGGHGRVVAATAGSEPEAASAGGDGDAARAPERGGVASLQPQRVGLVARAVVVATERTETVERRVLPARERGLERHVLTRTKLVALRRVYEHVPGSPRARAQRHVVVVVAPGCVHADDRLEAHVELRRRQDRELLPRAAAARVLRGLHRVAVLGGADQGAVRLADERFESEPQRKQHDARRPVERVVGTRACRWPTVVCGRRFGACAAATAGTKSAANSSDRRKAGRDAEAHGGEPLYPSARSAGPVSSRFGPSQ